MHHSTLLVCLRFVTTTDSNRKSTINDIGLVVQRQWAKSECHCGLHLKEDLNAGTVPLPRGQLAVSESRDYASIRTTAS